MKRLLARYATVVLVFALAAGPVTGIVTTADGAATDPIPGGGHTAAEANGTTLHYDGERVTLQNATGQTIRGETDREPGTTLTVRITSADDRNPFLRTIETVVAENGTFAATVDLSQVSPETAFEVAVRDGSEELASADGIVRDCERDCPPPEGGAETETPSPTPPADHGTALRYDGDRLTLRADVDRTVRGETSLEPGTTITVVLDSADSRRGFTYPVETTVAPDGTFEARFHLHDATPNATVRATVLYGDRALTSVEGDLVDCEGGCPVRPNEYVHVPRENSVARNETARVPIAFGGRETVDVTVFAGDAYELEATVRDTDGDSRAALLFDPSRTDDPGLPTLSVADGGEVRSVTDAAEDTLDSPTAVDRFGITVTTADLPSPLGESYGELTIVDSGSADEAGPTPAAAATDVQSVPAGEASSEVSPTTLAVLAAGGLLGLVGVGLLTGLFRP